MSGTLYIVATPIGNLEDITLRTLKVLKEVDLIAAEDTRHTKKLLTHFGIHRPLTSYHEYNERTKASQLIRRLREGDAIALVSDAGTPLLADPGFRLVQEAIGAGVPVVPIPGASALTAVLSAAGLATDSFSFEGFLPARKAARREKLARHRDETWTRVFYEVPHRLRESLQDLLDILGDRQIVVAREVTKVHEEFLRGRTSEIMARTESRDWRGEITLVIGADETEPHGDADRDRELNLEVRRLLGEGMRVKEIAELLGEQFSVSKRAIYRMALEAGKSRDGG